MDKLHIKKPPFFKEGSLVFKESGHKLIKSGKYYRCSQDSNQKCALNEKQILSETLERNFSRRAMCLHSDNFPVDKVIERLMRDHFWDLVFGLDDRLIGKEKILDSTVVVMQEEVQKSGSIPKSDIKDWKDTYIDLLVADHPVMLFGYGVAMIKGFSVGLSEAEMGRTLAHFSKKIYLNNEGTIESIELERWAWYVLNAVIEKNNPGYINQLKGLNIINGPDSLHAKGIVEASMEFGTEDFSNAMGEDFVTSIGWVKVMKDMMSPALENDPAKMAQAFPLLLARIQNDVALQIMMKANSVIKLK